MVIGGGVVGLSAAMMLARDGCDVTVLERDNDAVPGSPGSAWQDWDRRGIAQFRQPHYMHAAGCQLLATLLPEVKDALLSAGGTAFDALALLPPFIEDRAPRDGDERFTTYYTRYFRSPTGEPPGFITGLLTPFDSFSLLTLPGDAGTWSVTIFISSRDQALKELRREGNFTGLVSTCPLHAHLLNGEPVSEILAMSGIVDRRRRMVLDGTPVVTGILPVGDALCCTNPSLGRGMTMGLMHAAGTAEVTRDNLGDPLALAIEHDRMSQDRIVPWYRHTVELDRARKREIDASIAGEPAAAEADAAAREAATPGGAGPNSPAWAQLQVAMLYDADVFRAFLEIISLLTLPEEMMARPGFAEHLAKSAAGREVFAIPGPSREDLLRSLT